MESFASLFAGLGLFFIGIRYIGSHLKRMTGRRFRRVVAAATRRSGTSAIVGVLAGALTQSSNAVTFIAVGLVTAGLTEVRRAAPLVAWSNVGTAGLVLLAAVDLRLLVLFLLGLVGFAYYFDVERSARWRHVVGALLGIGLLFLGLQYIKAAAGPLRELEWMTAFLTFAGTADWLGLAIGLLGALILQSSATLTVMAVTLTGLGLLSLEQTLVLVLGSGVGSGLSVAVMAGGLSGSARQLAYFQVAVKLLGSLGVLLLFWLERDGGVPLLLAAVQALAEGTALQMALLFLVIQLAGALLSHPLQRPLLRICASLAPPAPAEALARPRFLYDQALEDSAIALELVEREQQALLTRLPALIPADGQVVPPPAERRAVLEASQEVVAEGERFLSEVVRRSEGDEALGRAMNLKSRNALLQGLCETLDELMTALDTSNGTDGPPPLSANLTEAAHALLDSLVEAGGEGDAVDPQLLRALTSDRSALMEKLRRDLLRNGAELGSDQRNGLLAATALFERLVWLIHRYAVLLPDPEAEGSSQKAPERAST
ncbi:Na/Pi symporter [Aquibaculum sediminis]|uniref:Na/Pi symporter n=1 Tax=Aquibaculum sediminis TaxID=3231907 RepID=UPI0034550775